MAGTSSRRITVASSRIATANVTPKLLLSARWLRPSVLTTTTRISAADVMIRPVRSIPNATAPALVRPAAHSSRMRLSRNTS